MIIKNIKKPFIKNAGGITMSSKKITKLDFLKMSNSEKRILLESRNEEALNILINDEDDFIRGSVAMYGNDEHRDILVNDKDSRIREMVAQYGNDFHRAVLVNDKEWHVRKAVAMYGNDLHRDVLINDENWYVRNAVAKYGNDFHRDILVNDENQDIRKEVAMYGNDSHRDILVNDVIERVSEYAKKYMGSTVHILTKRFGTYNQANLLQIFENGYKIISNCYETDSLKEWINKARSQGLSEEVIEKEVKKIKALFMQRNDRKYNILEKDE